MARSSAASRKTQKESARSKSSPKNSVPPLSLSKLRLIPQTRPPSRNTNPPTSQVQEYRGGLRGHGKRQQLLHHPGTLRLRPRKIS